MAAQKLMHQVACAAFVLLFMLLAACSAQTQDTDSVTKVATNATAVNELALSQSQISDKFQRLEKLMLRMAEYDAARNPRRAELIKKAILHSKEQHVDLQLETLVTLLNSDKLKRAIDNQKSVSIDLKTLLDLLETENRPDRLKDEKHRIKNYIKEVERILRMQGGVQGRTEGGVEANRLVAEQERVAQRTQKLDEQISENEQKQADDSESNEGESSGENQDGKKSDGPNAEQKESQDGESKDGEHGDEEENDANQQESENDEESKNEDGNSSDAKSKSGESKDGKQDKDGKQSDSKDGKSKDGESKDGESKDGESKDGESKDGESKDGESKDGESKDGESKEQNGKQKDEEQNDSKEVEEDPDFPGRKKIQEAEQRMREAQQRLAEANRKDAIEEQQKAREALEQAKAQLEEILRQMREEEIERTLAQLESRFRKMLEMQLQVYESTVRLGKISPDRRDRHVDLQAGKLSFQERRIVLEAEKCLTLLSEEGSSIAFPESVDQMRADMEQVVDRLARTKIDRITQGIEEDIIQALDEMVEALQQAQEDQEQREQQQQQQKQQQQQGDPEDQPLVDKIAELKMLTALQLRINKRTNRYARLLDDTEDPVGQADDEDLVDSLQQLAGRELRLHEITRDIVMEKNE